MVERSVKVAAIPLCYNASIIASYVRPARCDVDSLLAQRIQILWSYAVNVSACPADLESADLADTCGGSTSSTAAARQQNPSEVNILLVC